MFEQQCMGINFRGALPRPSACGCSGERERAAKHFVAGVMIHRGGRGASSHSAGCLITSQPALVASGQPFDRREHP